MGPITSKENEAEWPEIGEVVIATVRRITDYGAYVYLDEYEREGLLHVSEISSSWIRNIRDYVREGQKTVLKVLRIDKERGHVDLSLRRVSGTERKEKLLRWNLDKKAESLIRSVSERLKMPVNEVNEVISKPLTEAYGDLYAGLEEVTREGETTLSKLGVKEDIAVAVTEVIKEKIKLPYVEVKGILELQCTKPNGVEILREAMLNAEKNRRKNVKLKIYVISPPKYRIEATARDYKTAEEVLEKASEQAINTVVEIGGGTGSFKRLK